MRFTASVAMLLLATGMAVAKDVRAEIKVKGMTCGSCAVSVKKH